jgi:trimeric autotransporter adhesin
MANVKISQLPSATTPLGGTEVLPIVQGSTTKKVTVNELRSTAVTAVTGTAPVVSSGGTTPAISMAAANGSTNGYLTSTDWTTFNNKQPAGSYLTSGGALGTPSSGTATNLTGLPLTTGVTGILPVANGGNGTATPSLVAGSNVTITGTWPNQTVASTGGGGVTSFSAGSTGLTPATATTGAVTLAGTLAVANGGTGTATPSLVAGTNVSITGTWPNQTINSSGGGGSMVYPGAGIPLSTGTAWGTSYNTTGTGDVVLSTSPTLVTPLLGTPTSGNFSTGTFTWPTFNQNTTGTAANVTGTVAIANGGTGQTTAAAAITALTGTQTSGQYLRSNGTNAALAAIQAADVPTLNQNTTGTAANVTGTVAVANGGTGTATPSLVAGTNITISGSFPNQTINASGGGSPGGSNTQVQYNNAGAFAGSANLTFNGTILTAAGLAGPLNGTVGATTANTGAFTTLSATGVTTVQAGTAAAPAITTSGDTNTGIFFPAADTIAFAEGGAEAMRINSSGNVGIGTSSPSGARVQIVGDNAALRVGNGTQDLYVDPDGGGMFVSNGASQTGEGFYLASSGNSLRMFTSSTERARIDSSGNLLVGTTSASGSARFTVEADTSASINPMAVSNSRSTAATDYSILFYRNASLVGSIQTTLSATSYVTSSDYRLKEEIAPMTGALAKVAALKPVTYKWKSTGESANGFIAHELAEVCPDAVTGIKDDVDASGNPKYQGIDTSFLVATLTAAIQELKAEFDAYKATHP